MLGKRLALVPFGILLGLLLLEGGLRIGAFFAKRSTLGELPVAWVTGNVRVLCLGDSNTYGLWLERRQAYPQQLEALWNARIAKPKLEVVNLGVPGTNSSRLVRDMPRLLETFDPDILILMVGVNDFWTLPFPIDEAGEARPQKSLLARHSLVYRLYYLIRRGQVADQVEIVLDPNGTRGVVARHKARVGDLEFDMSFAKADEGLWGDSAALKENLHRLIEEARAAETTLYLMTYASTKDFYTPASQAIADVALETGTPLIDLAAIFEPICASGDCPHTLFPDGHPKASGYAIIAKAILDRLAWDTLP